MVRGSARDRHSTRVTRGSHQGNHGNRERNFLVSHPPPRVTTTDEIATTTGTTKALGDDGYADHQLGAGAGCRVGLHRSAQRGDLIVSAGQPESALVEPGRDRRWIEADTVVVDRAEKSSRRPGEADADMLGVGVLSDVGQRFPLF